MKKAVAYFPRAEPLGKPSFKRPMMADWSQSLAYSRKASRRCSATMPTTSPWPSTSARITRDMKGLLQTVDCSQSGNRGRRLRLRAREAGRISMPGAPANSAAWTPDRFPPRISMQTSRSTSRARPGTAALEPARVGDRIQSASIQRSSPPAHRFARFDCGAHHEILLQSFVYHRNPGPLSTPIGLAPLARGCSGGDSSPPASPGVPRLWYPQLPTPRYSRSTASRDALHFAMAHSIRRGYLTNRHEGGFETANSGARCVSGHSRAVVDRAGDSTPCAA